MQDIHGRRYYELVGERLIGIRIEKTNGDAQSGDKSLARVRLPKLWICGNLFRPQ